MSIVIAFIGKRGSVVAGDMREIILQGNSPESDQFEEELYSGRIVSDEAMLGRARELGVQLGIRDTKKKVREREDVLIGEISDFERGILRKRRLYITTGRFVLVEVEGHKITLLQQGEASRFVVLGNEITQQIAQDCITRRWKGGGFAEAILLIHEIMKTISRRTASVSKEYTLVRTIATVDIDTLIEQDRKAAR
ncbi:MAG: DUF2121 domain-containing protein [Methanomicrobiales archaeon]|nr:DUF2121 domain-containing protein [Methanomicrobiales archaeon]